MATPLKALVALLGFRVCLGIAIFGPPLMVKALPPKDSEPMIQVKVTIPAQLKDQAQRLAVDHGLTNGDLYRDCFIDGLSAQFEKYTKAEVYTKVRKRNEEAGS